MSLGVLLTLALAQTPESRVIARVPEGCEVKPATLRFSSNGAQVAYAVKKGKAEHPVTGEVLGEAFEGVLAPEIDRLGEHVAFRAIKFPKGDKAQYTLLVDGKKLASDAWIGPVAFSPNDSTPVFWQAGTWTTEDSGARVATSCALTFGKKKVAKWERGDAWSPPQFSDDGRFLYSVGSRQDGWDVAIYDTKGKDSALSGYQATEVRSKPGGGELAVTTQTIESFNRRAGARATMVILRIPSTVKRGFEGVTILGKQYSNAGGPVYSPDGKHVAYRAYQLRRFGVAIDSVATECNHHYVDELVFDPQSKRVAYVAIDDCKLDRDDGAEVLDGAVHADGGKWCVVYGDEKSPEFDEARFPRWSPDGARCAFASRTGGEWRVHVGEKASEAFDEIAALAWGLDGKAVWFGARKGRELSWNSLALE